MSLFAIACLLVHVSIQTVVIATSHTPPLFPPEQNGKEAGSHMRQFGWHRKPEGQIKEYYDVLTPLEMYERHVRHKIPLVFRGAVSKSAAIKLWTDNYLNLTYGNLDVLVELKKENRSYTTGRMRMHSFLELYKEKNLYVVSLLPKEMMNEVQAVNSVLCGTFHRFTHESNLWMSSGDTRSVIHFDADENLHCVLDGRKDFIVIEKKYEKQLYFHDIDDTAGSGFSAIDPDNVDLQKYPDIIKVPWKYTTLLPGDCVYLPSLYIHQVRSYGRSIAVTTLFTNGVSSNFFDMSGSKHYDTTGCEHLQMNSFHAMNELDFHWTYTKGDVTVDMGFMNVESIRLQLLRTAKAFNGIDLKVFSDYYSSYNYGEGTLDVTSVFDVLTGGKNNSLTVRDVRALTREQLKFLGRCLDPPHGPKAEDGKEIFFMPGEMLDEEEDKIEVEKSAQKRESFDEKIAQYERSILVNYNDSRLKNPSTTDGLQHNENMKDWLLGGNTSHQEL